MNKFDSMANALFEIERLRSELILQDRRACEVINELEERIAELEMFEKNKNDEMKECVIRFKDLVGWDVV
jgi:hypothetical protein